MHKSFAAFLSYFLIILSVLRHNDADAQAASIVFGAGKQGISKSKKPLESNTMRLEYRHEPPLQGLSIRPHIGALATSKGSVYGYIGLTYIIDISKLHLGFSFSPGLYHKGNGKKLGHVIEFKSQFEAYYDITETVALGTSISHLSNAGLSKTNPGTNIMMLELNYRI